MAIVPPETALQAAKREEEPCQGLKVHFGVVLGCKGGGEGKKKTITVGPDAFLINGPKIRSGGSSRNLSQRLWTTF